MRVLIAAGGTAGHINPALAIAGALKAADPTAEYSTLPAAARAWSTALSRRPGIPSITSRSTAFNAALNAENIVRNVIALWHLALSGPRTQKILNEVKPDLVIGCGGYAQRPCGARRCQAWHQDSPSTEQNAFPGVTNKLLAKDVDVGPAASADAVEKLGDPRKDHRGRQPCPPRSAYRRPRSRPPQPEGRRPHRYPELWRRAWALTASTRWWRTSAPGKSSRGRTCCTCMPPAAAA